MPASRRDILTAGAVAGMGAFVTRAGAATFGNPDEPPQGVMNTKGSPRSCRRSGTAEPDAFRAVPKRVHPARDRRWRPFAVLGFVQRSAAAHPGRRLGPSGHSGQTSRSPNPFPA